MPWLAKEAVFYRALYAPWQKAIRTAMLRIWPPLLFGLASLVRRQKSEGVVESAVWLQADHRKTWSRSSCCWLKTVVFAVRLALDAYDSPKPVRCMVVAHGSATGVAALKTPPCPPYLSPQLFAATPAGEFPTLAVAAAPAGTTTRATAAGATDEPRAPFQSRRQQR